MFDPCNLFAPLRKRHKNSFSAGTSPISNIFCVLPYQQVQFSARKNKRKYKKGVQHETALYALKVLQIELWNNCRFAN